MTNLRKYGDAPFTIAVLHGGPGASGEMKPVARELSKTYGALEPLQTKNSINGQIKELKEVLEQNGTLPIKLIGWSWGAWLGYLFAASYPSLVDKLILVSSGPFEEKYVKAIAEARLNRLNEEGKAVLQSFERSFNDPTVKDKNTLFAKFGRLFEKTDEYAPIDTDEHEVITIQFDIYQRIWSEAAELRRSGELLKFARQIHCPVVAIHGDYDPHPSEGVRAPLSSVLRDFTFILLKNCGHKPWTEKEAKDEFYTVLKKALE